MPVTQVGFIYYQDDPTQAVFRVVYPTDDDSELDDPQWLTLGVDPTRAAVMAKYPIGSSPSVVGEP